MYSRKPANRDGSKRRTGKPVSRIGKSKASGDEKKPFRKSSSANEAGADKPFKKEFRAREERSDKPFKKDFRSKDGKGDKPFKKEFRSRDEKTDKPFKKDFRSKEDRGDKPFRKEFSPREERSDRPFRSSSRPSGDRSEKPFGRKFESKEGNTDRPAGGNTYFKDRKRGGSQSRPYKRDFESSDFSAEMPAETESSPKRSFSLRERKPVGDRVVADNKQYGDRPSRSEKPSFEKRTQKANDGRVRLNKIIASSGICSRREADDMIVAGLVSVNGVIITELGSKVNPEDDIRYNGERLKQERLVYILMNKPKDYVTTTKDPFAKRTVMELIEGACKERVFPVGRLDRNTTGVLLITNDGDMAKKLTHPSYNRKKLYHVHLDKNIKQADLEKISHGFELEDGFIKADEINFIDPDDKKQLGIEVHSGKNRIVRRIFEHLEYTVTKLDRVYFAGLTKKGLQRGHWRFLTPQEIGMLKMGSYE